MHSPFILCHQHSSDFSLSSLSIPSVSLETSHAIAVLFAYLFRHFGILSLSSIFRFGLLCFLISSSLPSLLHFISIFLFSISSPSSFAISGVPASSPSHSLYLSLEVTLCLSISLDLSLSRPRVFSCNHAIVIYLPRLLSFSLSFPLTLPHDISLSFSHFFSNLHLYLFLFLPSSSSCESYPLSLLSVLPF